jgi:hypothetical protein
MGSNGPLPYSLNQSKKIENQHQSQPLRRRSTASGLETNTSLAHIDKSKGFVRAARIDVV